VRSRGVVGRGFPIECAVILIIYIILGRAQRATLHGDAKFCCRLSGYAFGTNAIAPFRTRYRSRRGPFKPKWDVFNEWAVEFLALWLARCHMAYDWPTNLSGDICRLRAVKVLCNCLFGKAMEGIIIAREALLCDGTHARLWIHKSWDRIWAPRIFTLYGISLQQAEITGVVHTAWFSSLPAIFHSVSFEVIL